MKTHIPNFTESNFIEIEPVNSQHLKRHGGCGVRLVHSSGGMHFQHDMTTAQARQMAQALLDAACHAEALAQKEAA
jgi:hypothetical protein